MDTKNCIKCGENKSLSEFYKHKMMSDGHLGKCKECSKNDNRKNREDKIEYYREYDRERCKLPHRIELNKKNRSEPHRRMQANKRLRQWQKDNPVQHKANQKLRNDLRYSETLFRPDFCHICGKENTMIDAHHEDYSKPLDVIWCCKKCHASIHKIGLRETVKSKSLSPPF